MQQLDAIFTEILTKQAQANEQRKQSGNTKNGAKNVSGSLSFTKQNTAAAVQGLPAKSREGQDNNRSTRANQANLSTNQEKSAEVSEVI